MNSLISGEINMKKLLTFIFSAVLAISAAAFAACEDIENRAMQSRIINAWLDENPNTDVAAYELSVDVRGVYGDTYVFYLNGPFGYAQALTYTFIDNVYFAYPDFQQLEVYNDGEIYSLEEAFAAGLLTHENLLDIQKKYHRTSSWSTTGNIIYDYICEHESLTADDLSLRVHWYGGASAGDMLHISQGFALFIDGGKDYDTAITTIVVDGVEFVYPTSQQLLLYGAYDEENDTRFITLSRAFELELLDHTQLLEIKYNYENDIKISLD